jgi:hypothetical protein
MTIRTILDDLRTELDEAKKTVPYNKQRGLFKEPEEKEPKEPVRKTRTRDQYGKLLPYNKQRRHYY